MHSRNTTNRVTLKDIARDLGVSLGTVSLALNDQPGVNAETRQRVKEYARRVHYRPNTLARAISSGRSRLVAVVLARLTDSFFEEIVQGIENVAAPSGYDVIVNSVGSDFGPGEAELVDRLIGRDIDGLISGAYSLSAPARAQFRDAGIPALFLGPDPVDDFDTLAVDEALGGRLAAEHLYELGHRHILFIGSDERYGALRADAADEYLSQRGAALERRPLAGAADIEGAYRAVADRPRNVTAVFCANDILAVGACRALHAAGIPIPGGVSVVGFDDLRWAALTTPALTTVHQPKTTQGEIAMRLLRDRMDGHSVEGRTLLAPRLIVRDSTGPTPTKG
jgi:LacI family transcriptional regulator/LacI family repressor for deo operon, udp, cdd, tsx, nupC, and nupG